MSDSIEVSACPECGQEIVYHCWHNGDDVSSVRMPITQAINLAEGERARLQQELKTNMKMRELFTDASKWTQGAYARDAIGRSTYYLATNAVSWCLQGAMGKCYPSKDAGVERLLYSELDNPAVWNDDPERTFAEVKALVERLDI